MNKVMRIAVARAVSIMGHPLVLLPVAALIAASEQGAQLQQLRFIGFTLAVLALIVLGYSWLQVRSGRWSHVDASVRSERKSLNAFLGALCFVSAVLLWLLTERTQMAIAVALVGALITIGLLTAAWVKISLHAMFAAFATALLWPNSVALVVGVIVTAAIVWSRLVLGRHVMADVFVGLFLGTAAGVLFQMYGMCCS